MTNKKLLKNPTKKQWLDYAQVLKNAIIQFPQGEYSMACAMVRTPSHDCGTVHCVAGWYATQYLEQLPLNIGYGDGVQLISESLGFYGDDELESWAEHNPEIWGNGHGCAMFYDNKAYDGVTSLEGVIKHLEGVAERSE